MTRSIINKGPDVEPDEINKLIVTIEYTPGCEVERRHKDGRIEYVEAGPWSLIEYFQFRENEDPQLQGVWYFNTKEDAEEFRGLKYTKEVKTPSCPECGNPLNIMTQNCGDMVGSITTITCTKCDYSEVT